MGRFDTIKTTIDANIKENGSQEITGQKMNSVLTEMVNATDAELTELESEVKQTEARIESQIYEYIDFDSLSPMSLGIDVDKWVNYKETSYKFIKTNNASKIMITSEVIGEIAFLKQRPICSYQHDKTVIFSDGDSLITINGDMTFDIPNDALYIGFMATNVTGENVLPTRCALLYDGIDNINVSLKDKIVGKVVDVNKESGENVIYDGKWTILSGYTSMLLPCIPNHTYIVKGNSLKSSSLQMLSEKPIEGEAVKFSSGINALVIPKGKEVCFRTPSDATYLAIDGYNWEEKVDGIPAFIYDVTDLNKKPENFVDLSKVKDYPYVIDGEWKKYSGYTSKVLSVKSKEVKIRVKGTGCTYALIASKFLTKQKPSVEFVGTTDVIEATPGEDINISMPKEAKYLYLYYPSTSIVNLIGDVVELPQNEIDVEVLGTNTAIADGKYIEIKGYDSTDIPIKEGYQYLISANDRADVAASWTCAESVANEAVSFAIGASENSVVVPKGREKMFIAPNGAKYLNLNTYNNTVDGKFRTPKSIVEIEPQIGFKHPKNILYVAASDSSVEDKVCADYICTGDRDNETIQKCINSLRDGAFNGKGGEVVLFAGHYNIGSFPKMGNAINFPSGNFEYTDINHNTCNITIRGYTHNVDSVIIQMPQEIYDGLYDEVEVRIFGSEGGGMSYNHHSIQNIHIHIPSANKPIVCVDGKNFASLELINVICNVNDRGDYLIEPTYIPNYGCIGVRGNGGSNNQRSYEWKNVECFGFGQGFAVGGEHLLMIKCAGCFCRYGMTFNSYKQSANVSNHPITLIDCCDEANMNLPRLCTLYNYSDGSVRGEMSQGLAFINFNLEVHPNWMRWEGNKITEETPNQYCGFMNYTTWSGEQIFTEGSGYNIRVTNDQYKRIGTTAERKLSRAPQMAQFFDTTLNKMCYLIDRDSQTWVDAMGNPI